MHPILCKLGPLTIYSYGFMVALGFGLATVMIWLRAPKFGLERDTIIDYIILVLLTGIAGARILYILLNYPYYLSNPSEMINLSQGGLVWYGGFIAALASSVWFVRRKALEFWAAADFIAPYVAFAQAFGRIGCFLNGCCYGIAAPEHFIFGDRQPTQLYSAALLFAIFAILIVWQDRRRFSGEIFLGYCMLYSIKRFGIEFLRGDNPKIIMGLTMSQCISAVIFIIALSLFKQRSDQWKTKSSSGSK